MRVRANGIFFVSDDHAERKRGRKFPPHWRGEGRVGVILRKYLRPLPFVPSPQGRGTSIYLVTSAVKRVSYRFILFFLLHSSISCRISSVVLPVSMAASRPDGVVKPFDRNQYLRDIDEVGRQSELSPPPFVRKRIPLLFLPAQKHVAVDAPSNATVIPALFAAGRRGGQQRRRHLRQ